MDVSTITGSGSNIAPKTSSQAEEVDRDREVELDQAEQADGADKKVQNEELLNQIKGLTEDGLYSVRFENDDRTEEMVVKIVDRESNEVIRQVPPDDLLEMKEVLEDLRGNLVDTVG